MSCTTCQRPNIRPALSCPEDVFRNVDSDRLMPFSSLVDTARAGCHRCILILEAVGKWGSIENPDSFVIGISSEGKWQPARGKIRGLYVLVSRKEGWERWPRVGWIQNSEYREFRIQFELYTECEKVSRQWDIPLLRSIPSNPSPADYARQATEWLNHCVTAHINRCPPVDRELPTRVIELGDESRDPRIYESKHGECGQYAALSYCWGLSRTFTTTIATFDQRRVGFKLDELPKTIRDSVLLARNMGLKYLWADSLCIIQDSATDWEYEAARMCSVYTQATITFAAVDSPESETGLFVAGGRRLIQVGNTDERVYARKHYHGEAGRISEDLPYESTHIAANVLMSRGWTLQELLLSSRILWMKGTEMCWSCLCETACECDPKPTNELILKRGFRMEHALGGLLSLQNAPPMDSTGWLWRWFDLVETYTSRSLTNVTDRLPAIAGLATWLKAFIKERYLFGMWETDDILKQLLWHTVDSLKLDEYYRPPKGQLNMAYAPSWSWASCWGQIAMPSGLTQRPATTSPSFSPTTTPPGPLPKSPIVPPNEMISNTPPTPQTPIAPDSPLSAASLSFLTHRAANHKTFGRGYDSSHSVWRLNSISINLGTTNEFGPGSGMISLHSLLVPLKFNSRPGTKPERTRPTSPNLRSFDYNEEESDITTDSSLILFSEDDFGDVWRPDDRYDYVHEKEWYNEKKIYFIFAELGVVEGGSAVDFSGLVLQLLDENAAREGKQPRRFRRLGYAESFFQESKDEVKVMKEKARDINPDLPRNTWTRWQELGTWETIALV